MATLTPEDLITQLRALREAFEELKPLTFEQRRDLRNRTRTSPELLHTSISAIGVSDKVSSALGRSADEVRDMVTADRRWNAVEGEARAFLNEVSSANLTRRYELSLIATQTFSITEQLVRDPKNDQLVPVMEEMRRLRKLERRKKSARADAETDEQSQG
jgi:hypothetical protein